MTLDPVLLSRLQWSWVIAWHILLPAFTGTKGQTRQQFVDAVTAYGKALQAYFDRASKASSKTTHCVGTTIDQFNQAQAPGATITLECTP